MIITIVCDILGNKNNGLSVASHNLIDFLSKKGHEVRVVCPDKDKNNRKNFYISPSINFGIFNNYVKKIGVIIAKYDSSLLKSLENTDIVYIMTPFFLGRKMSEICKKRKIPCVFSFHISAENIAYFFGFKKMSKFINYFLYKKILTNVNAIHCLNNFRFEKIKKNNFGIKKNIYIISNGVPRDFFVNDIGEDEKNRNYFLKNKILILNISRYSKQKKQKILIKAMKYSKYKDKIQLIFLGIGPQKEKLKKIALKERLHNYPIFDFINHKEIANIIKICDLYVHTSDFEDESLSILEAIAGGLIPIISDSEGYGKEYILTNNNVFKKDNCKDLAKKIDFWIEHENERKKNRCIYSEFIKKFNLESCMSKIEEMFIDIIKNHNNYE